MNNSLLNFKRTFVWTLDTAIRITCAKNGGMICKHLEYVFTVSHYVYYQYYHKYIQSIILWPKLYDVQNYFSIESTCFYDVLEHPPKDPGESLSPYYPHVLFRRVTFIRCKEECDNNPRCNNIKMCDDGCTLFDKPLFKNAPASDKPNPKNCYTIFKTCPGSNWNISI